MEPAAEGLFTAAGVKRRRPQADGMKRPGAATHLFTAGGVKRHRPQADGRSRWRGRDASSVATSAMQPAWKKKFAPRTRPRARNTRLGRVCEAARLHAGTKKPRVPPRSSFLPRLLRPRRASSCVSSPAVCALSRS